ncbi:MAG: LacI family DNA-binding transcriptional regulator [Armatimonadetes bacterium]|nr:LacI family DNA-binding transcriptional regulator [Armatimonadota bacterium]
MATTLKDVAREAGVAVNTASKVLRGDPHPMVSIKTRERIMEAARRLRYRHNLHARQLRTGRSEVVGILAGALREGVNLARFQAVEHAIRARGCRTLLGHAAGEPELQLQFAKDFASNMAEGVVVLSTLLGYRYSLELLNEWRIPIVSLEPLDGVKADVVTVDRREGARLATRHLLELGHRRIAMLHGGMKTPTMAERHQGFREALTGHGCPLEEAPLIQMDPTTSGGVCARGEATAWRLLALRPLPTAVLCSNDEVAIGVMKTLAEAGVRVPEEMAVVGFDDIYIAAHLPVPLTTIAQPVEEQAARAVALLFERIEDPDLERPPQVIRLAPRLVVRASCGASSAGEERRAAD